MADRDLEGKNISGEIIFSDPGSSLKFKEKFVAEIIDNEERSNAKILKISSPIYIESGYAGLVSLDLDFDNLGNNQLSTLETAMSGHTMLLDEDYQILWAHDIGDINYVVGKGIKKFDGALSEVTSGNSLLLELTGVDIHASHEVQAKSHKVDSVVAVSPVKLGSVTWYLAIGAPKNEA